ncbi:MULTISPECIES: M48 family metallopeptidase [Myxococcus]|uniref:M48 family metallopeptidase n=1 Tax=Myxococcus TaxID=32 RepID=UPI00112E9C99|nr:MULTISPECIES: M48 family metallopeptidase [Myxococcus]NOK02964.1 M48 family metalloprotease [Myxococcus xanthus]QDE92500.1 peptidase M48 [Myxococcus xanthus]QDF07357.1 peptidase M48 [Myxococcus xanthus]WAM24959.1 M48 family metallopeptidase [Myxococcus sp. NMCA1]
MQRILVAVLGVTLALGLSTGCTKQRISAEKAVARTLISDEQEEQLGKQVKAELETKEKIKYVQNAAVVDYVRGISASILNQASKDRPGVKWKINVIDDPKTVNAFATPGGYLYVYTGLILAADTEAELAGVMAHEAGHVVGRHSARAMVSQMGLQAITQAALGQNPGTVAQIAASLVSGGTLLAHGRGEEIEADEYGARYASGAGYDPRGLITFFEKLQKEQGDTPALMKWLSTHPTNRDRIANIQKIISQKNLRGSNNGPGGLPAIKQALGGK